MNELRTTFKKPKYLSPEWFAHRRTIDGKTVFGASETPALMGVSPFGSLEDMVIKKINPPTENYNTPATMRGHVLEPALLEYSRTSYNTEIVEPDVMFRRGRLVSTLDGLEYKDEKPYRVFEAKTTTMYAIEDGLPQTYFWQGQAQLECTGAVSVVFVVLDRFMRLGFWEMEPDLRAIEELQEQAELIGTKIDNSEYVTNRDIPFTSQQIEALFPEPQGEIELDASVMHLIEMWDALKEQEKAITAETQKYKDQLASLLRDKEIGLVDGQKVLSYKRQTRKGGVDYDGFLKAHPDLAEQAKRFVKPDSSFRVLRKYNTK